MSVKTVHKNLSEIISKPQTRNLTLRSEDIEVEEEDLLEFSVSSELPVTRWFYTEILEHSLSAVNLERFKQGSVPVLFNHNANQQIGILEKAWLDKETKKVRVKARFSKRPFAQEILTDIRDGILNNVSVGYTVDKYEERGAASSPGGNRQESVGVDENDDDFTVVATRWTLYEVSFAPVPADFTVGIGRSLDFTNTDTNKDMDKNTATQQATPTATPPPHPEVSIEEAKRAAAEGERQRISSISALCARHGFADLAPDFISAGTSIEDARSRILDAIAERQKQQPIASSKSVQEIGLTEKEKKSYSLLRALYALSTGDYRNASFEREVSDGIASKIGRSTAGFFVPTKELTIRAPYTVLDNNIGAQALVPRVLREQDFIDYLREEMLMPKLGATVLNDLQGIIDIPKQTGGSSGFWTDGTEFHPVTETNATFGKISLSPKTVGAKSRISRYFMLQTSMDAENFVRRELAKGIAEAMDLAALYGAGSSTVPLGIFNAPGVLSVVMGTNGGPLTWETPIRMQTMVAEAFTERTGSFKFLVSPRIRGFLKTIQQPEFPVWVDSVTGGSTVNGYDVVVSNYLRTNRTKGTGTNLCDLVFGAFNNLIVGNWGQLEILANPYGAGEFDSGSLAVRALMTADLAYRYPEAFVVATDINATLP